MQMDDICDVEESYTYGECLNDISHKSTRGQHKRFDTLKKSSDNVNHPTHYTSGGVECIEALKAATINLSGIEAVCTANAIKYLWRWKQKNGVEDLNKAIWYIEYLKSHIEKEDKEGYME